MWNLGHLGQLSPALAFDLKTKPVLKLEFIKEASFSIKAGISNNAVLVNVYPLSALSSSLAGGIGKCEFMNEPIFKSVGGKLKHTYRFVNLPELYVSLLFPNALWIWRTKTNS